LESKRLQATKPEKGPDSVLFPDGITIFLGEDPVNAKLVVALFVPLFLLLVNTLEAQEGNEAPRIGMLRFDNPNDLRSQGLTEAFRQGLRALGYTEGRTILVEYRYADGKLDRLPKLAAELVALSPAVIVTQGTPATLAASKATGAIPIVVGGAGDLLGAGLVASLARPGGNVTGSTNVDPELSAKRLQLLREALPHATRVAVLYHGGPGGDPEELRATLAAARDLRMQIQPLRVQNAGEFQPTYAAIAKERADALIIFNGSFTLAHRKQLIELAAMHHLPTMCGEASWSEDGGLISYGYDREHQWRRAATYVDKILKGARPADLPIEQPLQYHLVVNLKTAEALKLKLPDSVMLRANKLAR
jgi:putative tryptophan/tyrosine transport system substrate-binding protein